ncbi:unnamed protein product [Schistosoma mattheei]|uniref:Uncharacterized protein n=1 Tax=Schistosoma mattheei TaxID=31246 RepID=A0A3P8G643_9TREM|nr:unnamed protein product [Schistosoma mattheei]
MFRHESSELTNWIKSIGRSCLYWKESLPLEPHQTMYTTTAMKARKSVTHCTRSGNWMVLIKQSCRR